MRLDVLAKVGGDYRSQLVRDWDISDSKGAFRCRDLKVAVDQGDRAAHAHDLGVEVYVFAPQLS